MKRIGVLGDVHAEDALLRAALARFEAENVDAILCVGDIVDGPGDVEATIALLRDREVIAVAGNHERWFFGGQMRQLENATQELSGEAVTWLRTLPKTRRLETAAGPLLLCHGVGEDDMIKLTPDSLDYDIEMNGPLQRLLLEDEVRVMIGGHTHRRMVRTFGPMTVINAGTLFRLHDPCCVLVDLDPLQVEFVELSGPAAS